MVVNEIKEFLRIDGTEEDTLIQGLFLAAQLYLTNAGVTVSNTQLYNLSLKLLIGHWYENRSVLGKPDKISFSLDSIITQLKYANTEYNEAIIKLIEAALCFNDNSIESVKKATDILIQAGGTL